MQTLTPLKGRDFLSIHHWSREELASVLADAIEIKRELASGICHKPLLGRTLAMIFSKQSTRTRVSFEVGMFQLGGKAIYLNASEIQLGRGETVADTARTLSCYVDGIMIRTFAHAEVEELSHFATVPVINGLTDREHPCQIMADLLTIRERKGGFEGLKLAYVGDGNNVAHSLLHAGAKFGMQVAIASPNGYMPDFAVLAEAKEDAQAHGAEILLTTDPREAVRGADVVYTDVWASMGQEAEAEARRAAFQGFQVNEALMALAAPDVIFLHCLPAHRGEEVSAGVIDGPQSVVFEQAGNRLHAQKAILALTMGE